MPHSTYFVQGCPTCGRRLHVRVEYLGKEGDLPALPRAVRGLRYCQQTMRRRPAGRDPAAPRQRAAQARRGTARDAGGTSHPK